jgi:YesN/AraC family two-component response regulator
VKEAKKYSVVIADDHPLLTTGLKMIVEQWSEFEVAGTCGNGIEAFAVKITFFNCG